MGAHLGSLLKLFFLPKLSKYRVGAQVGRGLEMLLLQEFDTINSVLCQTLKKVSAFHGALLTPERVSEQGNSNDCKKVMKWN